MGVKERLATKGLRDIKQMKKKAASEGIRTRSLKRECVHLRRGLCAGAQSLHPLHTKKKSGKWAKRNLLRTAKNSKEGFRVSVATGSP